MATPLHGCCMQGAGRAYSGHHLLLPRVCLPIPAGGERAGAASRAWVGSGGIAGMTVHGHGSTRVGWEVGEKWKGCSAGCGRPSTDDPQAKDATIVHLQVLRFAIDAVKAEAFNPKTLFLFGSYTIGGWVLV